MTSLVVVGGCAIAGGGRRSSGAVEEVRPDDSGLVQYAIVVPKADFENLTEVFVITEFEVVD